MIKINLTKGMDPIELDFAELPKVTQDYVIQYGLTQILADCHSQVTAKIEPDPIKMRNAARALVDKKLAALRSGEIRANAVRVPRVTDPIEAEARELVNKALLKGKASDYDAKSLRTWQDEMLTKFPTYMEQARKRVEELAAIAAAAGSDTTEIAMPAPKAAKEPAEKAPEAVKEADTTAT